MGQHLLCWQASCPKQRRHTSERSGGKHRKRSADCWFCGPNLQRPHRSNQGSRLCPSCQALMHVHLNEPTKEADFQHRQIWMPSILQRHAALFQHRHATIQRPPACQFHSNHYKCRSWLWNPEARVRRWDSSPPNLLLYLLIRYAYRHGLQPFLRQTYKLFFCVP